MNSEIIMMVIMLSLYRIVSLLVGLGFAYMGYKLFDHGVFDKAGDLSAAWGKNRLLLKQAAPGTFFSLFGTVIVVVALWKGMSFDFTNGAPKLTGNSQTFRSIGHQLDDFENQSNDELFNFGGEAETIVPREAEAESTPE
ncbi:hypothetical protein [Gimesia aquarii]|uniref:Uncharacterized protein n=1 Tax=Gimesia aquarii TaxID=2527964 RepID=A0A517VUW7_9PLAN|nr:hypothetical protein [Gimesia aquarii]QDT96795.1 hypothetical protein V144x_22530 [Gimesia aquarii]